MQLYKEVWEAAVEESLVCENASNRVAVKKELKGIAGVFAVFATGRQLVTIE